MGISKGNYPDNIKLKAIELLKQGKTYIEVQKELSISSSYTVRNWWKRFKEGGTTLLLKDERGKIGRPPKK